MSSQIELTSQLIQLVNQTVRAQSIKADRLKWRVFRHQLRFVTLPQIKFVISVLRSPHGHKKSQAHIALVFCKYVWMYKFQNNTQTVSQLVQFIRILKLMRAQTNRLAARVSVKFRTYF